MSELRLHYPLPGSNGAQRVGQCGYLSHVGPVPRPWGSLERKCIMTFDSYRFLSPQRAETHFSLSILSLEPVEV